MTRKARPVRRPRWPTALLATVLFGGLASWAAEALAEVPEHTPDKDSECPAGFQWSRGPAACKQADCPLRWYASLPADQK